MAAGAEGITLLSLYGDDEEDEEAFDAPSAGGGAGEEANEISSDENIRSGRLPFPVRDNTPLLTPTSLTCAKGGVNSKTPMNPLPLPILSLQQRFSRSQPSSLVSSVSLSPPSAPVPPFSTQEPVVSRRVSRGALTIVDYAHDEAAMSPEIEEEEIDEGCYIAIGTELQGPDGHSGRTVPVTSQTLAPNSQNECLQPAVVPELFKIKSRLAMDFTEIERGLGEAEISASISSDLQKDDPLKKFLPPAITMNCSEELQEKINKFLSYKRAGKSFNADLRKKKDYRNPDFLQHAVRYQDIEQIGSCFGTEVFDPQGYDKSDFYDQIEADMKREMERKAQERKRSQKIDFVSGGIQSGEAASALKMNEKISVVGVSSGANNELQPISTTVDAVRDSRFNRKSKWDNVCSS
ncbi:uncharacterized protein LOC110113866 isoform X1 [Dendrobium catenatum]|uniref:SAP30-binding protein n=1 Tax=Dendrobium catenatum TaxID=906689 RepID=A0A2I0X3F5_9ASPA|nr:uncharacterized protein LOC110113866 isoform X1 [Dendrobium catenatum]PKU82448.1 hypothetical protein MA16_Dca005453 [Dendrobium catenatum]